MKTKEEWTDKHRHVARKLVLEGGWVHEGFSALVGQMKANAKLVTKRSGGWNGVRRQIPEARRKWEQKARTSKKEWKWQRGIV